MGTFTTFCSMVNTKSYFSDYPIPIVLGSKSPRRAELLSTFFDDFIVDSMDIDETIDPIIPISQQARNLAQKKNIALQKKYPNHCIITADTIVVYQKEIFGKPKNTKDATSILKKLSQKTHKVYTGVHIYSPRFEVNLSDKCRVHFKKLSKKQIEFYTTHFNPLDKAGGYGIQDWIGKIGIEYMEGSFYTVMGFPIHKMIKPLEKIQSLTKSTDVIS